MEIGRVSLIVFTIATVFSIGLTSPIAHALFLTPVEIIDATGDGSGNTLDLPRGIATDSSGNVFVAGFSTDNVFKTEIINSTGGGIATLDAPESVATDSSGNVFVAGSDSDNVFKITPGGVITEIIDATGDGGNPLNLPSSVATDSSGNVFVLARVVPAVFQITPGGVITKIIGSTGDGGGNSFVVPSSVATDSSGNVFVAETNIDNVFKISTPGTCKTTGTPCTITLIMNSTGDGGGNGLSIPLGIATDSSGNVFVTGSLSANAFKISTPGTCKTSGTPCTITEIIDNTGDGGGNTLDRTSGVATDSSGNVFVTGFATDNAFKITPGGVITEIINATGDGGGNTLDGTEGVATDSSGNVFVSGRTSDNAFKIAKDIVIGGTYIPIDQTALLLAGVQSISMWMIPVVIAGIGIGVFVIKRRK